MPQGSAGHSRGVVKDTPQTHQNKYLFMMKGGTAPSIEESAELQGFTSERVHLYLQEVYVDSPHNNDGIHLVGGVPDNAIWKSHWKELDTQ